MNKFQVKLKFVENKVLMNDKKNPLQKRIDGRIIKDSESCTMSLSTNSLVLEEDKIGFMSTNEVEHNFLASEGIVCSNASKNYNVWRSRKSLSKLLIFLAKLLHLVANSQERLLVIRNSLLLPQIIIL